MSERDELRCGCYIFVRTEAVGMISLLIKHLIFRNITGLATLLSSLPNIAQSKFAKHHLVAYCAKPTKLPKKLLCCKTLHKAVLCLRNNLKQRFGNMTKDVKGRELSFKYSFVKVRNKFSFIYNCTKDNKIYSTDILVLISVIYRVFREVTRLKASTSLLHYLLAFVLCQSVFCIFIECIVIQKLLIAEH